MGHITNPGAIIRPRFKLSEAIVKYLGIRKCVLPDRVIAAGSFCLFIAALSLLAQDASSPFAIESQQTLEQRNIYVVFRRCNPPERTNSGIWLSLHSPTISRTAIHSFRSTSSLARALLAFVLTNGSNMFRDMRRAIHDDQKFYELKLLTEPRLTKEVLSFSRQIS